MLTYSPPIGANNDYQAKPTIITNFFQVTKYSVYIFFVKSEFYDSLLKLLFTGVLCVTLLFANLACEELSKFQFWQFCILSQPEAQGKSA